MFLLMNEWMRERKRECTRDRGEKEASLPLIYTPTRDQTHNLFGAWDDAPTKWAPWLGQEVIFIASSNRFLVNYTYAEVKKKHYFISFSMIMSFMFKVEHMHSFMI